MRRAWITITLGLTLTLLLVSGIVGIATLPQTEGNLLKQRNLATVGALCVPTVVGVVLVCVAFYHSGQIARLNVALATRVAERRAEMEEQGRLLDAVLDALPVAVIIADSRGRFLRTNRACDRVCGVVPLAAGIEDYPEWVGYWPGTGRRVQPREWPLSRAVFDGETCSDEVIVVERFGDRRKRALLVSAVPVRGADGTVLAGVVTGVDVTDRRASEERFRAAMETNLHAIFFLEAERNCAGVIVDFQFTDLNRLGEELISRRRAAVVGQRLCELLPVHRTGGFFEKYVRVVETAEPLEEEFTLAPADSLTASWFHHQIVPIGDGIVITTQDITRRKRAETALRQSEARFRSAFEFAPIGLALVSPEGRWLQVNRSLCEMLGYSEPELLTTDFQTITHPDDLAADLALVRQVLDGSLPTYQLEKRYVHKRGNVIHILQSVSLVRDDRGQPLHFISQIMDISHRKETEAALRLSEERFRRLVEGVADHAIFMLDIHGHVESWNPGAEQINGYKAEEILGRHFSIFYTPEALAAGHPAYELAIAVADGRYSEEGERVRKDGSRFWAAVTISTLRDHAGHHVGFVKFTHDVTQRKYSEEQIRASLREKEVLLKEIHHRVKNNLQIVSALLGLQAEHTTDPTTLGMFAESQGRVQSMALIHERLYRSQDMARVDFAEYIRRLAADLYSTYKVSEEDIALELAVDIPPLGIDIAIPCGLLLNELISNSLKHAFGGPTTECRLRVSLQAAGDGHDVLTVADNGPGFPKDFDLGTVKSFGMQLVSTLVEQLDGHLELTSDRGAAVSVTFPATKS